jgi:hypothetical protein
MFKLAVQLPHYGEIRIEELKNRDIFTIIKYCTAEDLEGLNDFLTKTLFNKLPPLSIVDKLYLLLFLRSFYIGDTLQLKITHEKVPYMDFYIENMMERIGNIDVSETKEVTFDWCTVNLGIPNNLYYESNESVVFGCVNSVTVGGSIYDFSSISNEEKDNILELLPGTITPQIYNFFKSLTNKMPTVTVIDGYPTYGIEQIDIRMLSNDPLKLVMMLFSQDISEFLTFMYQFVNKVGGNFNDFFELTFNDSKIIFDFYQEEMIKQNESLNTKQ